MYLGFVVQRSIDLKSSKIIDERRIYIDYAS